MTDTIAELRERHLAMADKAIADDSDHLDAPGPNDMAWLIAQLACWPTRVDPSCTTNSRFLMVSAAHSLRSLLDRVEAGEVATAALEDRAGNAERRYRHTRQWNAERWERIAAYAKEHGFWDDIACIMANGTLNVREGRSYDPPTYAQQLNIAIHRADAAEDRASKMQGRLEEAESSLKLAEDAMREMFRYYDGGETRGSYDGKPERNGLRKAWHQVRSTLSALQQKADTP